MSNIQSLNKDLYDKYDNRYIKRDEYSGGSAENTTYDNTTSGLTSTNVQGAIDEISEATTNLPTAGTQITGVLNAGETEITFTNDAITSDSTLNAVYTSKYGMSVNSAVFGEGSLTLTFSAQEENIDILVVIDARLCYGGNGAYGADGTNGKSAYEDAVEGGYTGTETEFAQLFNNMGGGNEWIKFTTVTGATKITLPSNYKELLIISFYDANSTDVYNPFSTIITKEELNEQLACVKKYQPSNVYVNHKTYKDTYVQCTYKITETTITLASFYGGSAGDEKERAKTVLYYR